MVDFKRFVGWITFECCCWNKFLTAKETCWIAWDTLSCMMIWFRLVPFLKAIMESVLKVSLQIWFDCNMCQCFVIIAFKFGNARLYVTDKGMHYLSWRFFLMEQLFSLELVNFLDLLCEKIFFVSFYNKLFYKFCKVTVVSLECWAYSPNRSAWL